jgi:hypothetical protein
MSSATSSYAQIAGRTKFFLVLGIPDSSGNLQDISGYIVNGLQSVTTLDPAIAANNDGTVDDVSIGSLLKDLGRQIVVYSLPGSPHTAVYRQVLLVDGATTEGIGSQAPFYVKVFSAAGTGVGVVRTG